MMSKYKVKPLDPAGMKTYPLDTRKSKVRISQFAKPFPMSEGTFNEFIDGLPDTLAARDFKELLSILKTAQTKQKMIIFALGAHVIKVGLNPVLIELMKRGWISALAMNGAGIIHDFELAYSGQTSEDVREQIQDGRFGMSEDTGRILNTAIRSGQGVSGLGEIVGEHIAKSEYPHKKISLLAAAYNLGIPVTVHVALGTDTIHFHPLASGEALGETSLRDFFLFCSLLKGLEGGGVFLNIGSAVILPEVFLKGVSVLRNKGIKMETFYTAVFDFIHHYRPEQNVIKRPLGQKGKGFYFSGHHEIMIPLLAAALYSLQQKK